MVPGYDHVRLYVKAKFTQLDAACYVEGKGKGLLKQKFCHTELTVKQQLLSPKQLKIVQDKNKTVYNS